MYTHIYIYIYIGKACFQFFEGYRTELGCEKKVCVY